MTYQEHLESLGPAWLSPDGTLHDGFGRWGHEDIAELLGYENAWHSEMNGWIRHSPEEGGWQPLHRQVTQKQFDVIWDHYCAIGAESDFKELQLEVK